MKSLAYKITAYITLFVLTGFGCISLVYYFNNKKQLHKEHLEKIQLINKIKKNEIESYINNVKIKLATFDRETSELTKKILIDSIDISTKQTFRSHISKLTESSLIENIYITSSKGDIHFPVNTFFSTTNTKSNFFDDKLSVGDLKTLIKPVPYFTISGVYENSSSKDSYFCYLFYPMRFNSPIEHGVIIAKLNMSKIFNIVQSGNNEAIQNILIKRNVKKYIQISPDKTHKFRHINTEKFTPLYNHNELVRVQEFTEDESKLRLIAHGEWCILTLMNEEPLFVSSNSLLRNTLILSFAFTILTIVFFIFYSKALLVNPLNSINKTLFDISNAKFAPPIHYSGLDEFSTTFSALNLINSRLIKAENIIFNLNNNKDKYIQISKDDKFNIRLQNLQAYVKKLNINKKKQDWLMKGLIMHSELLHKNRFLSIHELTNIVLSSLCQYSKFQVGIFYLVDNSNIKQSAAYGNTNNEKIEYEIGEGLAGECAISKKTIHTKFNHKGIKVSTGLGGTNQTHLLITPLLANNKVVGIIELCSINSISDSKIKLIESLSENIAHTIATLKSD